MARDLTKSQQLAAMARNGWRPAPYAMGVMGYWEHDSSLSVCVSNAGNRRRTQLAYVIAELERFKKREAAYLAEVAKRKAERPCTTPAIPS